MLADSQAIFETVCQKVTTYYKKKKKQQKKKKQKGKREWDHYEAYQSRSGVANKPHKATKEINKTIIVLKNGEKQNTEREWEKKTVKLATINGNN